ncbi:MAG: 50S ribosomal protein L24 [Candidatus Aenigmatarchaeota archaeon]
MPKCSFCSKEIEIGKGKVLIKNSGKQFWFCSRKCERSYEMGRDPRNFKWASKK